MRRCRALRSLITGPAALLGAVALAGCGGASPGVGDGATPATTSASVSASASAAPSGCVRDPEANASPAVSGAGLCPQVRSPAADVVVQVGDCWGVPGGTDAAGVVPCGQHHFGEVYARDTLNVATGYNAYLSSLVLYPPVRVAGQPEPTPEPTLSRTEWTQKTASDFCTKTAATVRLAPPFTAEDVHQVSYFPAASAGEGGSMFCVLTLDRGDTTDRILAAASRIDPTAPPATPASTS